jgi:hypothetical protein
MVDPELREYLCHDLIEREADEKVESDLGPGLIDVFPIIHPFIHSSIHRRREPNALLDLDVSMPEEFGRQHVALLICYAERP